jgi:Sulfatase-modifying factor enzyme 1/Protein of unknown function (DUF4019)
MLRTPSLRFGFSVLIALGGGCVRPTPPPVAHQNAPPTAERAAQSAAEAWLSMLDRGDYVASWPGAAAHVRARMDAIAFGRVLSNVRERLGPMRARTLESVRFTTTEPNAPEGVYVDLEFQTAFEAAPGAKELMTMAKEGDGRWRVAQYMIPPSSEPCPASTTTETSFPVPPRSLGLDPFYRRYLDAGGIPVVSSEHTSDRALVAAREIVQHMLSKRPDVRDHIIRARVRVVVMSPTEQQLDVPEQSVLAGTPTDTPGVDWNERGRGLGGTFEMPVVSCGEENLLCLTCDRYPDENVLIHEFGHAIQSIGLAGDAEFQRALHDAYERAVAKGLWKDVYAGRDELEYWAEGVQDWFDTNGNGTNDVRTRAQLARYDASLYALLASVLPDDDWRYSCAAMAKADVAGLLAATTSPPSESVAPPSSSSSAPTRCPAGMAGLAGGTLRVGYEVAVRPFCMDVTEVTVAKYAACVGALRCTPASDTTYWKDISDADRAKWSPACNGARRDRKSHPANCVDWNQADAYCRAQGERLPTEAEWEWAARAGDRGWTHPWGSAPPATQLCWSGVEKRDGTCAVGSFPAGDTPEGIHDLAGNVWEWTSTSVSETDRVQKGAGYNEAHPQLVQPSQRTAGESDGRTPNLGFRCVK